MKILTVCDEGNNRSITLAHQLKYLGHDVLSVGVNTNSKETIYHLYDWADKVIITEPGQLPVKGKVELWNLGPDVYPRPMNKELLAKVRWIISQHRDEL